MEHGCGKKGDFAIAEKEVGVARLGRPYAQSTTRIHTTNAECPQPLASRSQEEEKMRGVLSS